MPRSVSLWITKRSVDRKIQEIYWVEWSLWLLTVSLLIIEVLLPNICLRFCVWHVCALVSSLLLYFSVFFLLLFNCLPYLVNKDEYNNGCQDALILLRSSFSAPMVLHLCAVPLSFSRRFRDLRLSLARLHSANNQFKPIRQSVASPSS